MAQRPCWRPLVDRVGKIGRGDMTGELEWLLRYIEANPGRNTEVIAGVMKKSVPTISRYIKELKELGKVEFCGAPKTGGYYVRKEVCPRCCGPV